MHFKKKKKIIALLGIPFCPLLFTRNTVALQLFTGAVVGVAAI